MQRFFVFVMLFVLVVNGSAFASQLPDELLADAVLVLREIANQPDSGQMKSILKNAHGVAIFPSLIKVGLGIGGRYGEGLILKYDAETKTWYGPYFVNMKGLSYGFQVGIQSTSLVLVVATEQGITSLQDGKITLGGSVSVATGPIGRTAEASTDLHLKAAMYSYSLNKGAFIGASFEGASIDNNVNANQVYWTEKRTPAKILEQKAKGKAVEALLEELNRAMNTE